VENSRSKTKIVVKQRGYDTKGPTGPVSQEAIGYLISLCVSAAGGKSAPTVETSTRLRAWPHHLAWSLAACASVRQRMFSGVSVAPGLSALMSSTTYPGHAPFTEPVVGQGCFARNARTGAGFREICPLKSRTQLRQVGVWLVRGAGNLETMLSWAFRIAQTVRTSVPRRNGSGYGEGIAGGCARRVP
jgi:hypothetical protein